MKYVNSICNVCKSKSACSEASNHVAECHGYKNDCKNCKSYSTCLDEPMEDCTDYRDFRETAEARKSRIEAEVKAHDERIRAEVRADISKECKYLLDSGMGKKKALNHLIKILEKECNK